MASIEAATMVATERAADGESNSSGKLRAAPLAAPPAGVNVTLKSSTGGQFLPFSFGQAFSQGHVAAGQSLTALGVPDLQVSVKNRWPDGSVKFALVAGHTDLSANAPKQIQLKPGIAPPSAPLITTSSLVNSSAMTASIQFAPFGTASWSANDWSQPVRTVVSGPEMSSWTYRKPIGTDAHLVAWLEVRSYKGGRVEVLPWIENGFLKVASPVAKSGTATLTLSGTVRFSQPLNLLNHQRAVLASGSTLTHWVGAAADVSVKHDTGYLMKSRLVPQYGATTPPTSSLFARHASAYTPLMQGSFPGAMGTAGYHASIGLLPEWDVLYLTSGADERAAKSVIINAYAAGRYGTHYRDETTGRPLRFSQYPNLVMGGSSGVSDTGASTKGAYTPPASGGAPPRFSTSHHPSMGYLAYLISGWDYFLEETQFVATTNFLKQTDSMRQQTKGILETRAGANTTRGVAWAIRSLSQAAAITPDEDPLRHEFVTSLNENIAYYHGMYIARPNNPLGLVAPYSDYEPGDPWTSAVWMDDFFTAAFGYAKDLRSHGEVVDTKLNEFLQWKYKSVTGRLGAGGESSFPYPYAAQYTLYYAPSASANWTTGAGPWYASWGEVARAMRLPTTVAAGSALVSGYPTEATGYWGNLMPAIAYAVDHGAAGAAEAWIRMTTASNFAKQAAHYNVHPVWGVTPRGVVSAPPPLPPLAPSPAPAPTPAPAPAPTPAPAPDPAPPPAPAPAPTPSGTAVPAARAPAAVTPGTQAQPEASTPPAPRLVEDLLPGQWAEIPNTKIRSVLPNPGQRGYAPYIIKAWNGGTVDTARSRLLVWGGGHSDYWGNEMYALDLPSLSIKRIVEPSPNTASATCTSALPDGTPTSRHTYGGLAYIEHADKLFAAHGSLSPCGWGDWATWTYDFGANQWQHMTTKAGPNTFGTVAAYDPSTKNVYSADQYGFYAYSPELNRYTKLGSHAVDYHLSAAIDSKRRLFVMIGNGVQFIDMATGKLRNVTTTNAPRLVTSKQSPGIAYDPVADRIVAWHGGREVWVLNMDSLVWSQAAMTPGPTAAAPVQGTFGRFGYVPKYKVFAVINDIDQNAWIFRLAK
ncbi:MAG TPA: hypothetical protein VD932_00485 [Aquabacterium sp.]|nr:hypothetical protein [Aquabacterium sp.]